MVLADDNLFLCFGFKRKDFRNEFLVLSFDLLSSFLTKFIKALIIYFLVIFQIFSYLRLYLKIFFSFNLKKFLLKEFIFI